MFISSKSGNTAIRVIMLLTASEISGGHSYQLRCGMLHVDQGFFGMYELGSRECARTAAHFGGLLQAPMRALAPAADQQWPALAAGGGKEVPAGRQLPRSPGCEVRPSPRWFPVALTAAVHPKIHARPAQRRAPVWLLCFLDITKAAPIKDCLLRRCMLG